MNDMINKYMNKRLVGRFGDAGREFLEINQIHTLKSVLLVLDDRSKPTIIKNHLTYLTHLKTLLFNVFISV